ncbi:methionyl-tRNA formyltransferase [Buchnera aphidicola str. Bp (Baizongia pistaciae)]|uniref:Methionyl-tRNA formyltransferase n=1 Tax=Buchnera aphidicola subsp. Baizongia pistaciae (strain Bp) TaxID=224915 RepID=FMT_BUCBP|nr:methionyl-tRNA formyltransferase [Buchnera aphidicola]P59557.1 RecName: Full=Methionyl-tRNA formyltransferase [Buchnera aphidicola str. Bp (Baizongia pistaciae)]AAO27146.1 methionyl-tRNA formyltransferase [Buchnera aphidicola str. Bp (Baizongia pistaciae)]
MILNTLNSLKIVFAGTDKFSKDHLKILVTNTTHKILGVITKPDQPLGRGKQITSSLTKKLAKKLKIPVFQPTALNTSTFYNQIYNLNADIIIVVSYGKIIPQLILNIFPLGGINVHTSLLPRWRGPSPIQSALLNGDKLTGITIIKMNNNIDTGDIIYSSSCIINKSDTSVTLQNKLKILSCQGLIQVLKNFKSSYFPIRQSNLATYSNKINKEDAKLIWLKSAIQLERSIRAYNPWPICYFKINNQLSIKVWSANVIIHFNQHKYQIGEIILINKHGMQIKTSKNILNITTVQLPGKKIMHANNLCNSKNKWCIPGTKLTNT